MTATAANDPIRRDELDGLFAILSSGHSDAAAALAVSGGSDSTALMVLFADWLRQRGSDPAAHTVLTVDHGLRPESAVEAAAAARLAGTLGFRHATLVWEGAKPHTGLQAAAREARYRLMGAYAQANGIATLLTGHTLDDQAETLLMRLARGSGLDGLAGMAPLGRLGSLWIARPLLDTPKARLRATLEARGIAWIEDGSNQSPAFERTRLRAASAALAALGLTGEMLALSARRLQRARGALDCIADDFCAERWRGRRGPQRRLAHRPPAVRPGARGDWPARPCPLHCRRRRFGRAGAARQARADRRRCAPMPRDGRQLDAGPRAVTAGPHAIQVEREPGRQPLPCLALSGGASMVWDGRFAVAIDAGFEGTLDVRALGAEGLAHLRRLGRPIKVSRALHFVPSFWQASELLSAPTAGFWVNPDLEGRLSAAFLGLRYNSGTPGGAQTRNFHLSF